MSVFDDARRIADEQMRINAAAAAENARYNRIDEYSPFGQSIYSQNPDGTFRRTYTLRPGEQTIADQEMYLEGRRNALIGDLINRYGETAQQPLDFNSAVGANNTSIDPAERARIEDAIYQRYAAQLDPRFSNEQEQLSQRLEQQGIPIGSERYNEEMRRFEENKRLSYNDATSRAVELGGIEQSRYFDQAMQLRDQAVNEYMQERNDPLQAAQALYGQQQGVVQPVFGATTPVNYDAADMTGPYLGLSQIESQKQIAEANRRAQAALVDQQFRNQQALNEQTFGHQQQLYDQSQPSTSDTIIGIGGNIAGGVAQGIGYGYGQSLSRSRQQRSPTTISAAGNRTTTAKPRGF